MVGPPMDNSVRLDRWLWAARFFKTRAQAKTAIEAGVVSAVCAVEEIGERAAREIESRAPGLLRSGARRRP